MYKVVGISASDASGEKVNFHDCVSSVEVESEGE